MIYLPLKMRPCFKEYIWGGTRLKKEFGKSDAPEMTAESWELAAHEDGLSHVESGPYAGKSILELGKMDRAGFWGQNCTTDTFPILVKLIDAKNDLSIQVHPSDQTARPETHEQGKAEMWYIVDCEPQAAIYLGFSRHVTPSEFLRRAWDGSICEILNRVPVSPGDVFYILPGTIHAIGGGILIAEIQQNSNTTFRVYDYQRMDQSGKLRPLHLDRATEVLDYAPIVPEECKANNVMSFREFTMQEMFCCGYFSAYRIDVHPEIELVCDGQTFHHILCVAGYGAIDFQGTSYPFHQGGSFLMPAAMGTYKIKGACRVLLSKV